MIDRDAVPDALTDDWQQTRDVAAKLGAVSDDWERTEEAVNLVRDALIALARDDRAQYRHGVVTENSKHHLEWCLP